MATFSLGTSGITPGAPGVYINERPGNVAFGGVSSFSTVYMLVETDENVPVTLFPFNQPVPVTSLADYRVLLGGVIPDSGMPLLSYQCVNAFFQNAQVGDLRVVRVGTPSQIVEIEFLPSGSKLNSTALPSALFAGDKVYVQMVINGMQLVAGDGSTGYTSNGEWLGVPVTIPVNYVAGDEANNRKISIAIATAVSEAIKTNPAISSSVVVRDFGALNDVDPIVYANSENSFVSISSSVFNGNVSVVTQVLPVGSNYVFMQNVYDIENIVGGAAQLERVPQDYIQCIETAFDGIQDQGYLITPTAYAQFDTEGRAAVGAAAAAHCESNNYKWMALADPGPYLVTGINKYKTYTPHQPAADLVEGLKYLVDNVIYKWVGNDVTYPRLTNQTIVFGESAETAVNESANLVADSTKVGLLDSGIYTIAAVPTAADGVFDLTSSNYWPVTLPIQKVALSGASGGNDFTNARVFPDLITPVDLNGEVYVVAVPYDVTNDSTYTQNHVMLALNAVDASNLYNQVLLVGGSVNVTAPLNGSVIITAPTGDTAQIAYADPYWDLPVEINGQTSDLIENISGANAGVNTLHLPGTLQDATQQYVLNWVSRTLMNPSTRIAPSSGILGVTDGSALFTVTSHGLVSGQKIAFTQPITVTASGATTNLVSATTKLVSRTYWVKVLTANTFVISDSLANYTTAAYVSIPTGGVISTTPSILYSQIQGRGLTTVNAIALLELPMIRGRKYEFDTNTVWNQALDASLAPTGAAVPGNPGASIYLNQSAVVLGEDQIFPYGEDITSSSLCGWLPKLNLVNPDPSPVAGIFNALATPVVDQYFASDAFFVPAIDSILIGTYNGTAASGTVGPLSTVTIVPGAAGTIADGTYSNVPLGGGSGSGAKAQVTTVAGVPTVVSITSGGQGYDVADTGLTLPLVYGATTVDAALVVATGGSIATVTAAGSYGAALAPARIVAGASGAQLTAQQSYLTGTYLDVATPGFAPDGTTPVVIGDRLAFLYDGVNYSFVVIPAATLGGDLTSAASPCYGSQVKLTLTPEQIPPTTLWRFDAITSTEIIDDALRGVGFNGVPQAVFVDAGVDNVNRLYDDSQRYFNPFGFIAYYGPWIDVNPDSEEIWIPPSPFVTGVAVRRYRAEGYQFPPAGVKYQLAGAYKCQIPINSAQQNLLNPDGCNAIRTLPGYPQTSVFIWGGRTRVNSSDAQQKLYQFVNTRVILNVVYGSLRTAFDSQIFNVIDGFGVVYNQIISVGNSILNQLYVKGALFGAKPSDAFQVICDERINPPESLENGIVNAKVFVTPVPTLERIQIDLIRVAIGQMQKELDSQGLGTNQGGPISAIGD